MHHVLPARVCVHRNETCRLEVKAMSEQPLPIESLASFLECPAQELVNVNELGKIFTGLRGNAANNLTKTLETSKPVLPTLATEQVKTNKEATLPIPEPRAESLTLGPSTLPGCAWENSNSGTLENEKTRLTSPEEEGCVSRLSQILSRENSQETLAALSETSPCSWVLVETELQAMF